MPRDAISADICEELKNQGLTEYVQQNTGLIIDSYFSATKIKWILPWTKDCPFFSTNKRQGRIRLGVFMDSGGRANNRRNVGGTSLHYSVFRRDQNTVLADPVSILWRGRPEHTANSKEQIIRYGCQIYNLP